MNMRDGSVRTLRTAAVLVLVGLVVGAGAVSARDNDGGASDDTGPGPFSGPMEQTTYGWILVPTPEPARVYSPMAAQGVTLYYVHTTPDAPYALESQDGGGARLCVLSLCTQLSDFDMIFFKDNGQGTATAITRAAGVGDEAGRVPADASFGLVYMKTPGLVPSAKGYGFVYREGGAGSDVLPNLP